MIELVGPVAATERESEWADRPRSTSAVGRPSVRPSVDQMIRPPTRSSLFARWPSDDDVNLPRSAPNKSFRGPTDCDHLRVEGVCTCKSTSPNVHRSEMPGARRYTVTAAAQRRPTILQLITDKYRWDSVISFAALSLQKLESADNTSCFVHSALLE